MPVFGAVGHEWEWCKCALFRVVDGEVCEVFFVGHNPVGVYQGHVVAGWDVCLFLTVVCDQGDGSCPA